MKLHIHGFDLRLKYPFSISRHTYYNQPVVMIGLQYEGVSGFGEATYNPYYNITTANLRETFEKMNRRLGNYGFTTPDKLWDDFSDFLPVNSFALAALNNAAWDIYGKLQGVPVTALIDLPKGDPPLTSYTLGIASEEKLLKKITDFPWPVYKIKLGTDHDPELMKFIREHTEALLRVDANCAWNARKTIEMSKDLKRLGVEYIEQPLPYGDPRQKECFEKTVLPLYADESCRIEEDVVKCVGLFHGINIKLLKCGGLTPAIRMVRKARENSLKVMVGCMTESSVGIAAAAQLLPFIDHADLDGPLLLAEDLASGLRYENGYLIPSPEPGLGVAVRSNQPF